MAALGQTSYSEGSGQDQYVLLELLLLQPFGSQGA